MRTIVGIGETVLDIIFREGQPVAAVPGGSTFNSMVSLGRTAGKLLPDVKIMMATRTGNDKVGSIVTSFMEDNGIDTRYVLKSEGSNTPVSLAFLDKGNNASYEFYRSPGNPGLPFEKISFGPGDILMFGSFFAINPGIRADVLRIVEAAHKAGAVVYYDINFRKSHLDELPAIADFIKENCRLSDVVRGSSEDIQCIFGTDDAMNAYKRFVEPLCPTFICTRGADETEVFSCGDAKGKFPVPETETVSTIGAGDNFNAGFVYGLLKNGFGKERVHRLDKGDWSLLVPTAIKFSGNVCRSIYNYVSPEFAGTLE